MTIRLGVKGLAPSCSAWRPVRPNLPETSITKLQMWRDCPTSSRCAAISRPAIFLVRDRVVWVRDRKSAELLKLEHYVSYLPDGHYNCTDLPTKAFRLE